MNRRLINLLVIFVVLGQLRKISEVRAKADIFVDDDDQHENEWYGTDDGSGYKSVPEAAAGQNSPTDQRQYDWYFSDHQGGNFASHNEYCSPIKSCKKNENMECLRTDGAWRCQCIGEWEYDHLTKTCRKSESTFSSFKFIAGMVTAIIVLVVVCLGLSFCGLVCITAKMSNARGAVIWTENRTTTDSNEQTVTAIAPIFSTTPNPVVASPSNSRAGSNPDAVEESASAEPLNQPVQNSHPPEPINDYPCTSGPQSHPQELPPPYPGLPRDPDSLNLPYNPYFTGPEN